MCSTSPGKKCLSYNVYRCWVSEYQALPELDAAGNAVMIQTIKLENEGWERDTAVVEPRETESHSEILPMQWASEMLDVNGRSDK